MKSSFQKKKFTSSAKLKFTIKQQMNKTVKHKMHENNSDSCFKEYETVYDNEVYNSIVFT